MDLSYKCSIIKTTQILLAVGSGAGGIRILVRTSGYFGTLTNCRREDWIRTNDPCYIDTVDMLL